MNVADANLLQPKTKRQRAILALIAARPSARKKSWPRCSSSKATR